MLSVSLNNTFPSFFHQQVYTRKTFLVFYLQAYTADKTLINNLFNTTLNTFLLMVIFNLWLTNRNFLESTGAYLLTGFFFGSTVYKTGTLTTGLLKRPTC